MLHYKEYNTYDDYVKDQTENNKNKESYLRKKVDRQYGEFLERFKHIKLKPFAKILCLGARFGGEVRAFRDLGYNALGVDLLGDEKDLVVQGDWNNLPFEDDSYDAVYTNSIDHVSSLQDMVAEVKRVLRPNGIFITEMQRELAGNWQKKFNNPKRYESMLWDNSIDVVQAICDYGLELKCAWKNNLWEMFILKMS